MPLGEDESKVKRCALFNTNSAMNFNNGVVTCIYCLIIIQQSVLFEINKNRLYIQHQEKRIQQIEQ